MTQRKNKSVKNLDTQLTSHEASRYLELAEGTEILKLVIMCMFHRKRAHWHPYLLSQGRHTWHLTKAFPGLSHPPWAVNHGGDSAGQGSGDEVSEKLHHLDKSLTPPGLHFLMCRRPQSCLCTGMLQKMERTMVWESVRYLKLGEGFHVPT